MDVVTGAFGYSGKYIARALLGRGRRVRTLISRSGRPDLFGGRVEVSRLAFNDPRALVENLRGATTLYNTYWVRFPRGAMAFDDAVANTQVLIEAARQAGVARIVHLSVTNPSEDLPLPYFRGKAQLEKAIISSGLSYAIVRPTVIFGVEDILINNIAWLLRRSPIFAIPGRGEYRVQPIFASDLAEICVNAGEGRDNVVIDAVGPETYTYNSFVRLIREQVHSHSRILHVPSAFVWLAAKLIGTMVGDVLLTWNEIRGLMLNLLVSDRPPTGHTRFSQWLSENSSGLGTQYASELRRHFDTP